MLIDDKFYLGMMKYKLKRDKKHYLYMKFIIYIMYFLNYCNKLCFDISISLLSSERSTFR